MNHCHKRMAFVKRIEKPWARYRVFRCNVCGTRSMIFDNGHRIDSAPEVEE